MTDKIKATVTLDDCGCCIKELTPLLSELQWAAEKTSGEAALNRYIAARNAVHSYVSAAVQEAVEKEHKKLRQALIRMGKPKIEGISDQSGVWNAALAAVGVWLDMHSPSLVTAEMAREKQDQSTDAISHHPQEPT